MSSNQKQQQNPNSLRGGGGGRRAKKLPDIVKVILGALYFAPIATSFAYSSGMWKFDNDSLDNIISSGSIIGGIFGFIFILFVIKHLEDLLASAMEN